MEITLLDVSGRRVKEPENAVIGAGHHVYPWDGASDAGSAVSAGVCFYCLRTRLGETGGRLVWMP
ncbi:MAG: hypothetical protein U0167_07070 [bacterium]